MYRNSYQRGLLTVFFSGGAKPLEIWEAHVKDGYISRFLDPDIKTMVLEIGGTNVSTTHITCPKGKTVLGITMPFLVMIVKNLKKYFTFEVTILDETNTRRRFRVSNFQSQTQILPLCTVMPIGLSEGWNQIQFNLAEFTKRAYQKQFVEVQKLKINANIRLRRIYFAERLMPEDQLPAEYKLYFPLAAKLKKGVSADKPPDVPKEKVIETILTPIPEKKDSHLEVAKIPSKESIQSVKKTVSEEKTSKDKVEEEDVNVEIVNETDVENEKIPSEIATLVETEEQPVEIAEDVNAVAEGADHAVESEEIPVEISNVEDGGVEPLEIPAEAVETIAE